MPYDKELAMCGMNAGNSAAVLLAALIARAETPLAPAQVMEVFDGFRAHIMAGTLKAAQVELALGHQNPLVNIPTHPPAAPYVPPAQPEVAVPTTSVTCIHGTRVLKSGTSSKGAWTALFCALPKDAPNKCEPIFT